MSGVLFYNKCRIKTNVLTSIQLTEAEEKDVNFYDYDGFRLLSYTNAEALALTELPENHAANENLTFDEWNWTLADIKTQINNVGGVVNVGAIYHTTDDKTHITCKPTETFPRAYICLTPTASNAVTVDWGDGTTDTWTSASQETKSHTYTGVTDSSVYDITISCSSGTYSFPTYFTGNSNNNKRCIYTDIKLSNKATSFGSLCFQYCISLHYIVIPRSNSFTQGTFAYCYSLQSINIPSNTTSFGGSCFYYCYSLQYVNVSSNLETFANSCFSSCFSLKSITIPNGIETLTDSNMYGCNSLKSVTIPESVESFGSGCFNNCNSLETITIHNGVSSMGSDCFTGCTSLQSIIIPSTVTSLGLQCFWDCYSLQKIYMKPTTPPTIDTNIITSNSTLVIYVPAGTLSTYQNAEIWSSYASKIKEYNF